MIKNVEAVQRKLDRALALAHAALEDSTPHRVAQARASAAEIVPTVTLMTPAALALGEARDLLDRLAQLRAVMKVLDRKLEVGRLREAN